MSKPIRVGLMAVIILMLANADAASAGNWSPNNAMVLGSSTNFELVITPTGRDPAVFACESVTFTTTTSMAGSNEFAFTPTMTRCSPNTTGAWTTAGNWKAVSVRINAGEEAEANLEIPLNGFEFEPTIAAGGEDTCKVKAKATTVGEAKDYFNRSALIPPSFLFVPVAQVNKVKIEAKNGLDNACFTAQDEVPIVYSFNIFNRTTGATAGIHVN